MHISQVAPLARKLPYVDEINFLEHRWYCEGFLTTFHNRALRLPWIKKGK